MHLDIALQSGCRVRHRDWPPYHYAQLCPTSDGELRLCRIVPNDDRPPVELQVDALQDDQNWKILDLLPE
jgi:hypothetical protein